MYRILEGDAIEVLRTFAEASVDAIVTDPPYGLEFMGKDWDAPWKTDHRQPFDGSIQGGAGTPFLRSQTRSGNGASYGADQRAMQALQDWHFAWATEALRVLKPGGHLLAFGGSRTYHRLACAVEDAGFEIRDQIMWIYGSGFPKSLDVSKAIDKAARGVPQGAADPTSPHHGKFKSGCSEENPSGRGFGAGPGQFMKDSRSKYDGANRKAAPSTSEGFGYESKGALVESQPLTDAAKQWRGWGTALKPAHEPIVVARKPLTGTVAANVLQHGTGALNIDGCRVGNFQNTTPPGTDRYNAANFEQGYRPSAYGRDGEASAEQRYATTGSTNFSLLPGPRGGAPTGRWPANVIHDGSEEVTGLFPQTASGAMRQEVDAYEGESVTSLLRGRSGPQNQRADAGSAARFFYCPKADREERNAGCYDVEEKPLLWSSGTQSPGTFQSEGTKRSAPKQPSDRQACSPDGVLMQTRHAAARDRSGFVYGFGEHGDCGFAAGFRLYRD